MPAAVRAAVGSAAPNRFTTQELFRARVRGPSGRDVIVSAPGTTYHASVSAEEREKRSVAADIIHGSHPVGGLDDGAIEFWSERRRFGVASSQRRRIRPAPMWDRMAQTLVLFTRTHARVMPELAFRSMAMFLRVLMMTQVTETRALLLPAAAAHNAEGVVGLAKAEAKSPVKLADASAAAAGVAETPAASDAAPAATTPSDSAAPPA